MYEVFTLHSTDVYGLWRRVRKRQFSIYWCMLNEMKLAFCCSRRNMAVLSSSGLCTLTGVSIAAAGVIMSGHGGMRTLVYEQV